MAIAAGVDAVRWYRCRALVSTGPIVDLPDVVGSEDREASHDVDRGAAIRIRAAIEATLREQGSYPSYAEGLIEADARFRSVIHEVFKEVRGLAAEFDVLFPPAESHARRSGLPGGDIFEGTGVTKNARMHLAGMSGWLQGLIDSPSSSLPD